ncbi:MAG: class I SAM-dependent methyltransferase [Desulfobacterales bacterium]|nr:class I SAM-dependent methyltransferase [Desulfobacterales bacterium]
MAVIDIGCGAGVDTLFAALMVGPGGKAGRNRYHP